LPRRKNPNGGLNELRRRGRVRVDVPPEIVPAVGLSATDMAGPSSGPPVTPSSSPALAQVPPVIAAVEGPARDLARVVTVDLDRHR
jgi:hypothetical protein